MPSSNPMSIPAIIFRAASMNPQSILDVGVGFGKWGMLMREYLEVWEGRYRREDWQLKIDGIEPFPEYIRPWHREFYDEILLGTAEQWEEILPNYDLVLWIDVIEHMEKVVAKRLLAKCKNFILTTPASWSPQPESFGNANEKHVSLWYESDFEHAQTAPYGIITAWKGGIGPGETSTISMKHGESLVSTLAPDTLTAEVDECEPT